MVLIGIKNCNDCNSHEVHGIYTSDSFENETGIYCGRVNDSSESWERHTHDGRIDKKLVHNYDTWGSKIAKVPSWCPLLIESYRRIIEDISRAPRQPIEKNDKEIIKIASYIIETLGRVKSLDGSVYRGALPYGSVERDLCLIEIAQLCKSQFMVNEKEDIEHLGLGEDDVKVLKAAIKVPSDGDCKKLIKDFDQVKEDAKGTICKPVLGSEIAVPAALYLADMIVRGRYYVTDLRFVFKDRGEDEKGRPLPIKTAELHYTAKTYVEGCHLDYVDWAKNGEERHDILRQDLLLKKIFGIKHYKYYINGTRIPISEIKKH